MALPLIQPRGLTAQQRLVVKRFVDHGGMTLACQEAAVGGDPENAAWQYLHNPQIVAAIQAEISLRIRTKGSQIAQSVLMEAAQAKEAPWSTRVDAAKTLLDRAGLAAMRSREPDKPAERALSDYSVDELKALVDRLERERGDQAKTVDARQVDAIPAQEDGQDIDLVG